MPLPPALAAKLLKRGIVEEDVLKESLEKKSKQAEEEVIAESYDGNTKFSNNEISEDLSLFSVEKHFKGHHGCPNKWNIYHECSSFCSKHWGHGNINPDPKYLRKQVKLLTKYPLPHNWKEIYDAGTGRHYYWEIASDMVSWLPPGHPKAVISESAAILREERHLAATDRESDKDSESEDSEDDAQKEVRSEFKRPRQVEFSKGRSKSKANDLDPMDPASYSDIPRGRWSDGLERGAEAKTGADVTAAGPLYQMRPYPSPGAVLRANASFQSAHKNK